MLTVPKKELMFTVYLGKEAHQLADRFSQNQTDYEKAEQVYLNTLAVYAVNFYLQCLGLTTDFFASHSRLNLAVLIIKDKGKLECRYVVPGSDFVEVPEEALSDRIGYIAVEINAFMKEATLLGFTEKVPNHLFPLNQLRSLDDFPAYLSQINNTKFLSD